jgi:hypothetical protein
MFNLAIDSKLRGCDLVALSVEDVASGDYAVDPATVRQKKTSRAVKFELADQTREAVDNYLQAPDNKPDQFPQHYHAPIRATSKGTRAPHANGAIVMRDFVGEPEVTHGSIRAVRVSDPPVQRQRRS